MRVLVFFRWEFDSPKWLPAPATAIQFSQLFFFWRRSFLLKRHTLPNDSKFQYFFSSKIVRMSSSLLLDSFVIQEQHQSTQIQSENTQLSPIAYQFFNEHEQELFEETSSTYRPTICNQTSPKNQAKLKKCTCCPYGYHIDLDFIRYCEELAANGKRPSTKQLDRRNKRLQRKSLEVMLGFEDQWVLDFGQDLLHPSKQHKSEFQTVYEVTLRAFSCQISQINHWWEFEINFFFMSRAKWVHLL